MYCCLQLFWMFFLFDPMPKHIPACMSGFFISSELKAKMAEKTTATIFSGCPVVFLLDVDIRIVTLQGCNSLCLSKFISLSFK